MVTGNMVFRTSRVLCYKLDRKVSWRTYKSAMRSGAPHPNDSPSTLKTDWKNEKHTEGRCELKIKRIFLLVNKALHIIKE